MTTMKVVATHSTASVLDTRMSKHSDATITVRTVRGYRWAEMGYITVSCGTDERGTNAPSSDGGPEQQGRRGGDLR